MTNRSRRLLISAALALFALAYGWVERAVDGADVASDTQVEHLFAAQRSGEMVEAEGVVVSVLSDDRKGSRHQRFIVRLDSDHTVLISHNIDLAPRVDGLQRGDVVEFRGQYEWNERGGVVHWTHHDPDGRRPGGWLRHAGRSYR